MAYSEDDKEIIFENIFKGIKNGESLRKCIDNQPISRKVFFQWLIKYKDKQEQYEALKHNKITSKSKTKASIGNISKINKNRFPDGYIYIVRLGNKGIFKIGVSNNPDRRIKDIDSYSPIPIREVGRFYFKNVYEIEEMIHDNLKNLLIRREWFKLTEEHAFDICKQIKEMSDNGIYLIRK